MKTINANKLFLLPILLLIIQFQSQAQQDKYQYKRAINDVTVGWHDLEFPNDIYNKISKNFADIRLVGITSSGDTIKVPYLIENTRQKSVKNFVSFKKINTSHQKGRYFMTFEVKDNTSINQIEMDFVNQNFDMQVKLEGSNNQKEWFTVLDNYRILSIHNTQTIYQFTKIVFPDAKYKYFRVSAPSKLIINIKSVGLYQEKKGGNTLKTYQNTKFKYIKHNTKSNTRIEVTLPHKLPVSQISLTVKNPNDYYRSMHIMYLADSVKMPKGWHYNYRSLRWGTLTSIEDNSFTFSEKLTHKIRIDIINQDNQALDIKEIKIRGYAYKIKAHFDKKAQYLLLYGNKNARKPQYDLVHFKEKIPKNVTSLSLGNETVINDEKKAMSQPLFKNKNWLWAIMIIIIAVLGWFSFQMIRKMNAD